MWLLLITVAVVAICYWIMVHPYKYWKNKGVDQLTPVFPLGDMWATTFRITSFPDNMENNYYKFSKKRYFGLYQFTLPALVIRDPDLVKRVTVKDFDHFTSHRATVPEDSDPLWAKNLISLKGQRWRETRSTLSPTFTSSKMKYFFSLMLQNGEQFVNHFLNKNEDVVTLEMKDTFTRFTSDVISSIVFGIECDSLSNKNNDFYIMAKEATDFTKFWKMMKFMCYFLLPGLSKMFNIKLFSEEVRNFFTAIVKTNIESRQKHGIIRPDMINLLLEARKHGLKYEESSDGKDTGFATAQESEIGKNQQNVKREITDLDITAHAIVFIFAGFDTVSSMMCFMSYELAVNPEIQERLRQEVDDTLEACNGKLTYEALLGMKYMDMVVSETLRKWPITIATDRAVTKPYTIEAKYPDEKPVHLTTGDAVLVPIYSLQRDPEYFPDPERFDPERFSDENKHKIKPYTYMPFGAGPRNCIGSRFALLETKTLFFFILTHFEIVPVEKTQIPLVISKKIFNLAAENGFWFGLKRRVK